MKRIVNDELGLNLTQAKFSDNIQTFREGVRSTEELHHYYKTFDGRRAMTSLKERMRKSLDFALCSRVIRFGVSRSLLCITACPLVVAPAHSYGKVDEDDRKKWHQNEGSNETRWKGLGRYYISPWT